MKVISEKRTKRIITELCLLTACCVLALAGASAWLKKRGFSHIRELAVTEAGGLAVFEETGSHYIFWIFDPQGRFTGKIKEAKKMTDSGPEQEYSGMALLKGEIYLQRKTYSGEGELIRESIVNKTEKGTVEIYNVSHQNQNGPFFTGALTVWDGQLFFMQISVEQDDASFTLRSYDENSGVKEVAALSVEGFGWNDTPAYIGNGDIVFADEDSKITTVNVFSPKMTHEMERAGAIQSIAAGDGSYAYFDVYSGHVVLNALEGGSFRLYTDKLLSPRLCLGKNGLMAIEFDEQRNGKKILFLNLEEEQQPEWSVVSLNWLTRRGIREALIYALFVFLGYGALRIWLFLLVERHMPVTFRVVLIVMPLAAGCAVAFYCLSYWQVYRQTVSIQENHLKAVVQKRDEIERIKEAILKCGVDTPVKDTRYRRLAERLSELTGVRRSAAPYRTFMYYGIMMKEGGEYYSLCFGDTFNKFQKKANMRYLYKDTALDALRLCMEQKEERYFSPPGEKTYYFYQTPVIDGHGGVAAVLEIGINLNMIKMNAEAVAQRQTFVVIIIVGALTGAFIFAINLVLQSLRSLKSGVERITRGERDVVIPADAKDELGEIAGAFNLMSAYVDQKSLDSQSFHKFVPEELSVLLGRGVAAAALGDHADLRLAVLRLGMDKFYALSDRQICGVVPGGGNAQVAGEAQTKFERLAYCYNAAAKIVRREKGYMRQMDDARGFSLYQAPERALEAALEICGSLREYGCRAAIDYGDVTVAVLGDDARFQTAAVSGLMERLRVLQDNARGLGVNVLLTHEAFCALETPDIYRYRFLGTVSADGFTMRLYDFFDADEEESRHGKCASLNDFRAGIAFFYEGRRVKARNQFIRVLKIFPGDNVSRRYLSLCEEDGKNCLMIDTGRN